MSTGAPRRDDGFSLTELMVVLALLGFVLATSYAVIQLAFAADGIQRRDAFIASSIGEPLQMMDVTLSQNVSIESASSGDYALSCLTDADADNQLERHVYTVSSEGELREMVYTVSPSGVNTSLRRDTLWERIETDPPARNVNVLLNQPVFSYRAIDASGSITPTSAASADMVEVRLHVRYDGKDYSDSRKIMFRNR